jgi:ribosomal protein S12 methylthiotransferase
MDRLAPDTDMLALISKIRDRFADTDRPACIRTTLIAGYPGETDADVDAMLDFLESARIDRLTVFEFSPEEGTPSASLPDQVPEEIAESRVDLLMETQQEISLEINEEWVGKEIDVLIEGETDDGRRAGRSYRDAPEIDGFVIIDNLPDAIPDGAIVHVKVTNALPYDLEASM